MLLQADESEHQVEDKQIWNKYDSKNGSEHQVEDNF